MNNKQIDVAAWIFAANELCIHDEPERALKLLDLVPAFDRDNPHPEIVKLKQEIYASLITANGYGSCEFDSTVNLDPEFNKKMIDGLSRGYLVKDEAIKLNTKFNLVEIGPGEYWLPLGLKAHGFSFNYKPVFQDQKAHAQFKSVFTEDLTVDPSLPTIFVCHEIIEHLSNPCELAWEMMTHCPKIPEFIHVSTPHYCVSPKPDWKKKHGQPHLRAYTPHELHIQCAKIWPTHEFAVATDGVILTARGILKPIKAT